MKFMKLGSKLDTFHTGPGNTRFVKSELASDITILVGDVKFSLHKFPLLSKSGHLRSLLPEGGSGDEIELPEIPGGPNAFEICAKFCYGMAVTLNAYNVVAARCAAHFLGMNEDVEKGNLIFKIEVFLSSSIFRSWKDSIIVLRTTPSFSPLSEELKVAENCVESLASKACVDVVKVNWTYSYNRNKLPEENAIVSEETSISKQRAVPRDWWVEDLCELEIDLYEQVVRKIRKRCKIPENVIGESLKAYAYRKVSGFVIENLNSEELDLYRLIVRTLVNLLPREIFSVSSTFLMKLLKLGIFLEVDDDAKGKLIRKIGEQLDEAPLQELVNYDPGIVKRILEEFFARDRLHETGRNSKILVAKLVDGYLAELGKDPKLPVSKFLEIAEMVSCVPRPFHDSLYQAVDTYLKEHPSISKMERKRICRLMDCRKLSAEAATHAVQNERLPLRFVVQVLFFEQVRMAASSGSVGSWRSSRSAATDGEEEDGEEVASAYEAAAVRGGGAVKLSRNWVSKWERGSDSSESLLSSVQEAPKPPSSCYVRSSVS